MQSFQFPQVNKSARRRRGANCTIRTTMDQLSISDNNDPMSVTVDESSNITNVIDNTIEVSPTSNIDSIPERQSVGNVDRLTEHQLDVSTVSNITDATPASDNAVSTENISATDKAVEQAPTNAEAVVEDTAPASTSNVKKSTTSSILPSNKQDRIEPAKSTTVTYDFRLRPIGNTAYDSTLECIDPGQVSLGDSNLFHPHFFSDHHYTGAVRCAIATALCDFLHYVGVPQSECARFYDRISLLLFKNPKTSDVLFWDSPNDDGTVTRRDFYTFITDLRDEVHWQHLQQPSQPDLGHRTLYITLQHDMADEYNELLAKLQQSGASRMLNYLAEHTESTDRLGKYTSDTSEKSVGAQFKNQYRGPHGKPAPHVSGGTRSSPISFADRSVQPHSRDPNDTAALYDRIDQMLSYARLPRSRLRISLHQ